MSGDFFSKFERDLRELAAREIAGRSRSCPRRIASHRLAIAVVAVLLAAGAGAAATDLLPVGSKVPVRGLGGPSEPKRLSPRVVVATGRTPIKGRWQMFWSRSSDGDCEALQFLDEPGPGAGAIGEGCGGPSGLTVRALIPVPNASRAETVINGRTPEDVAAVRVRVPGLGSKDVRVEDGPADVPGNWYLAAFPGVPRQGAATVEGLNSDGERAGPVVDLPIGLEPRYPPPSARYVGPARLIVSHSGLVPVALACERQRKRLGKCLGTVWVLVRGSEDDGCRRLPPPGPICSDRGPRLSWQYYRLSPRTKERTIHVRLPLRTRRRLAREGHLPAVLRYLGKDRHVTLLAP